MRYNVKVLKRILTIFTLLFSICALVMLSLLMLVLPSIIKSLQTTGKLDLSVVGKEIFNVFFYFLFISCGLLFFTFIFLIIYIYALNNVYSDAPFIQNSALGSTIPTHIIPTLYPDGIRPSAPSQPMPIFRQMPTPPAQTININRTIYPSALQTAPPPSMNRPMPPPPPPSMNRPMPPPPSMNKPMGPPTMNGPRPSMAPSAMNKPMGPPTMNGPRPPMTPQTMNRPTGTPTMNRPMAPQTMNRPTGTPTMNRPMAPQTMNRPVPPNMNGPRPQQMSNQHSNRTIQNSIKK